MTDELLFDDPGGNRVEWSDYLGKLLIFWPLSQETVKTEDYGDKDAIRANMVDMDGDGGPEEITDVLVFPLVLQGRLKKNLNTGRPIVGRLGQGKAKLNSRGEEKQKPPWELLPANDADRVAVTKYLTDRQAKEASKSDKKFDDVPF